MRWPYVYIYIYIRVPKRTAFIQTLRLRGVCVGSLNSSHKTVNTRLISRYYSASVCDVCVLESPLLSSGDKGIRPLKCICAPPRHGAHLDWYVSPYGWCAPTDRLAASISSSMPISCWVCFRAWVSQELLLLFVYRRTTGRGVTARPNALMEAHLVWALGNIYVLVCVKHHKWVCVCVRVEWCGSVYVFIDIYWNGLNADIACVWTVSSGHRFGLLFGIRDCDHWCRVSLVNMRCFSISNFVI